MKAQRDQRPVCPICNYELTGVVLADNTATCPECGTHGNPTTPDEIRIEKTRRRSVDRQFLMCIAIFVCGPVLMLLIAFAFAL